MSWTTPIKVYGSYDLVVGQVIYGQDSGSEATIKSITESNGVFTIDYSLVTVFWVVWWCRKTE